MALTAAQWKRLSPLLPRPRRRPATFPRPSSMRPARARRKRRRRRPHPQRERHQNHGSHRRRWSSARRYCRKCQSQWNLPCRGHPEEPLRPPPADAHHRRPWLRLRRAGCAAGQAGDRVHCAAALAAPPHYAGWTVAAPLLPPLEDRTSLRVAAELSPAGDALRTARRELPGGCAVSLYRHSLSPVCEMSSRVAIAAQCSPGTFLPRILVEATAAADCVCPPSASGDLPIEAELSPGDIACPFAPPSC